MAQPHNSPTWPYNLTDIAEPEPPEWIALLREIAADLAYLRRRAELDVQEIAVTPKHRAWMAAKKMVEEAK